MILKTTQLSKIAKEFIDKNENKIKSTLTRLILISPNFLQYKHNKDKMKKFLKLDLKIKATSAIGEVFQSDQMVRPKRLNKEIEAKGADVVAYYKAKRETFRKNGRIVLLKPFDTTLYYRSGSYKITLTNVGKAVLVHEYVHHLLNNKKIIGEILKLIDHNLFLKHNNGYSLEMINEGFADLTAWNIYRNYNVAYIKEVELVT